MNLAKQFILDTRSQTRKMNKIIRLMWTTEKALTGRIRPTGRSLDGPDIKNERQTLKKINHHKQNMKERNGIHNFKIQMNFL